MHWMNGSNASSSHCSCYCWTCRAQRAIERSQRDGIDGFVVRHCHCAIVCRSNVPVRNPMALRTGKTQCLVGKSGIPILRLYVICSISIELLYVKWFIAVLFNAVLREKTVVEFVELSIPLRARCKHRATWMRDVEHWRTVMP